MGVWGGFKRAYVHNGRQSGGARGAARQNVLRELREKITRLAQNCPFTLPGSYDTTNHHMDMPD